MCIVCFAASFSENFSDILTYLLTYSMVQSTSWEANWFAASQEIPRISRNPQVHYRTHKRTPTLSILGQPSPVHIPTSHLLEIHPNVIHPSTPRSPQWSLSLRFPHQGSIHPLSSLIRHIPLQLYVFIQTVVILVKLSLHSNFLDGYLKTLVYKISWKSVQLQSSCSMRSDRTRLVAAFCNFRERTNTRWPDTVHIFKFAFTQLYWTACLEKELR